MLEKIRNNQLDDMIEILNIKLKLFEDIYDLTCKQAENLKNNDIDGFIKILDRKDIRIKKIVELDKRYDELLGKIREKYNVEELNGLENSSIQLIKKLKDSISDTVRNICSIDKENEEKFKLELNKVKSTMINLKKGRKVTSSYYKAPTQVGGYFIDKKR